MCERDEDIDLVAQIQILSQESKQSEEIKDEDIADILEEHSQSNHKKN